MTRVSINLNPSNLGANFSLSDTPFFPIEDLDEPFKTTAKNQPFQVNRQMLRYFIPKKDGKTTSTTEEDGGADDDDDKATVEAVSTEATRVHGPFMFP